MASHLHPKFHRHNHHTIATSVSSFPDAAHDPIASYDRPFIGTFVCDDTVVATANNIAFNIKHQNTGINIHSEELSISAVGDAIFYNNIHVNELTLTDPTDFTSLKCVKTDDTFDTYWVILIENEMYGVRLWKDTERVELNGTPPVILSFLKERFPYNQTNVLLVSTAGTTPMQFQWYRDSQIILEETAATLVLETTGIHTCVVTNNFGTVSSSYMVYTDVPF